MRNHLSHTAGVDIIGFIMCGSYKIALYTVLLCEVMVIYYYFQFLSAMLKMREHTCRHLHSPLQRSYYNVTRVFHIAILRLQR